MRNVSSKKKLIFKNGWIINYDELSPRGRGAQGCDCNSTVMGSIPAGEN